MSENEEKLLEVDDNNVLEKEEQTDSSSTNSKKRNIVIFVVAVTLLFIVALVYFLRGRQTEKAGEEEAIVVVSVKTAKAVRQPIAKKISAIGTIFPREQATVSASIGAQIKKMQLLKNAVVQKGDVIATLESRDLQAQRAEAIAALQEARLNQRGVTNSTIPQGNAQADKELRDARAAFENAKATYQRRKDLYAKGGISLKDLQASQLEFNNAENNLQLVERNVELRKKNANPNEVALAESRVKQAEERIKSIDVQISFTVIRAPITGIITDQFQFEGEYAASGARLVNIADTSEVIVKASFADSVVANLKDGDSVKILSNDLVGEERNGKVTLISRSTDTQNRTVEIWVNLGNGAGRLHAGSAAQVIVSTNQTVDAVTIPVSAVTLEASNADEGIVMVVGKDGKAHEKKVTVGIRNGDMIQISEGLNEGEEVITEGNYALPEGTKVEVSNGG